ncbi:hypothetical protein Tco_0995515 [Tanacetum coccineum]
MGSILNTPEKKFSTFDGVCHQTFRAARFDVLRTTESDNDDEEEYEIKRNKFGAPIYGLKPAPYLNCTNPTDQSSAIQTDVLNKMGVDRDIDDMLRIRLREAGSNKEIFTLVAWIRAFNINEPIYAELYHEFYLTYKFDEVRAVDELQTKKIIKFRLGGRAHSLTLLEFARRLGLYQAVELDEEGFNGITEAKAALSEGLIDSESRLIPEDPQPGVPRVGIPRPLEASMHDLYDRMGHMEIHQEAIERMEYMQSYHWDRYQGVFEHMAGVYSVSLQGAYNPSGYAQPQYDQYYQQYPPPPPQYQQQQQHHDQDDE